VVAFTIHRNIDRPSQHSKFLHARKISEDISSMDYSLNRSPRPGPGRSPIFSSFDCWQDQLHHQKWTFPRVILISTTVGLTGMKSVRVKSPTFYWASTTMFQLEQGIINPLFKLNPAFVVCTDHQSGDRVAI
jgi:hypothetical protein